MDKNNLSGIAIVLLVIVGLYFLWDGKETWQGFYYPNGCLTCTEDYIFSPIFDDKVACLAWANNLERERNNPSDDFECGKNCKSQGDPEGPYICDETVDS